MANLSYENDEQTDERLNPATRASNLHAQEQQSAYNRDFDGIVNNLDSPADDSQENENIEKLRQGEENPEPTGTSGWVNNVNGEGNQSRTDKVRGFFRGNRNKAAAGGIIGGVGIIGVLFSIFGPMSMVISLTENLLQTNDGANSAYQRRITKVLGLKLSDEDHLCDTKRVKCKMGRITTKGLVKIAKKGVIPLDADGNDLSKSQEKYPEKKIAKYEVDGEIVEAGKMREHLATDPKLAAKLLGRSGAFNVRFEVWRGKFIKKNFYDKFNIKRDGGLADGENKRGSKVTELTEKLKSKLPSTDGMQDKAVAKINTKTEKLINRGKKGGIVYLTAVGGCVGIKAPSMIAYGVGAVQLARLLPLSSQTILSPGSKEKASMFTNVTPEDAETVGTVLTSEDKDGKTPLDSKFLQSAFGANTNKTGVSEEFSPAYSLGKNPAMQTLREGDAASESACNSILSPQAMYTAAGVNAAATVAANATIVGGVIKVAAEWAISEAVSRVISKGVAVLSGAVIADLAKNDELDKAFKGGGGEKLGDAIGVSAMAFFSTGAAARTVPVLKKSQLTAYNNTQREQAEIQKRMDLASLSPFDISSKYTFLGSIVNNANMAILANGSYRTYSSSLLSYIALAPFKLLSPTTHASAASDSEAYCGYAKEFNMESDKEDMTPAVNAAGLPCYGYTGNIPVETAIDKATGGNEEGEKWVKDEISNDEADIEEIAEEGSRLDDYLKNCGSAAMENGEWSDTAAGCTIDSNSSTGGDTGFSNNLAQCDSKLSNEEKSNCFETSEGVGKSKARASTETDSEAVPAFAMDYQISQMIDGNDDEPIGSSASGPGVNVMTWNILSYTSALGSTLSSSESKERTKLQSEVIMKKNPDIISVQELSSDKQKQDFSESLSSYSSTLLKSSNGKDSEDEGRSIFWKTDAYEETSRGYYYAWHDTRDSLNSSTNKMVWVKLKQISSGNELYVFDTHEASSITGGSDATRKESAQITVNEIKKVTASSSSTPIIYAGHTQSGSPGGFSSGNDDLIMHNALTAAGFINTFVATPKDNRVDDDCETAHNTLTKQDCGKPTPRIIDNIYVRAPGSTVNSWENVVHFPEGSSEKDSYTTRASDANPVIASLNIPGFSASVGSGAAISCSAANTPPPSDDKTRVTYQGKNFDTRTLSMIHTAEDCAKKAGISKITILQGSYSSSVALSGSSHSKGGAVDVSVAGLSSDKIDALVAAFRMAGFAAWYRDGSDGAGFGGGNEHIHAAAIGTKNIGSPGQVTNYCSGGDGLYGKRDDRHLKTIGRPLPTWAEAFCKRYP